MKTFLFGIYMSIKTLPYLWTQNYTHGQIRDILKQYFKLGFLSLFFPAKKQTSLFSWKFFGPNMGAISALFGEMRVKGEYNFDIQNKKPIIFDLGANIGDSVLYFKRRYPQSTIYAFEPDPQGFVYLQENVVKNKFAHIYI